MEKYTATTIRLSTNEQSNEMFKPGEIIVTFPAVTDNGELYRETHNNGSSKLEEGVSVIASNGPILDRNGNQVVGNYVKNDDNEWIFEIDSNGKDILEDIYVFKKNYVEQTYGITPTTEVQSANKIGEKCFSMQLTKDSINELSDGKTQTTPAGGYLVVSVDNSGKVRKRIVHQTAYNNTYRDVKNDDDGNQGQKKEI